VKKESACDKKVMTKKKKKKCAAKEKRKKTKEKMLTLSEIFAPSSSVLSLITLTGKKVPLELRDQVSELLTMALNNNLLNKYETEVVNRMGNKVLILLRQNVPLKDILTQLLSPRDRAEVKNLVIKLEERKIKMIDADYSGVEQMEVLDVQDISAPQPVLVDNYVAEKELGRGSFGVVYLAKNITTGEKVVIKELKKITGGEKVEFDNLLSLKDECRRYFVCVKEYIDKGNKIYIVMEYLENFHPLTTSMNKIKLAFESGRSLPLVNTIIKNICQSIKYMHTRGVAHNDIKPDNMMVNDVTGEIRFIDFGLSCKRERCLLGPGSKPSGTPYYIDPVQATKIFKNELVTPEERSRADLWAFGIIIYEMIMGRVPAFLNYNDNIRRYIAEYNFLTDPNRNYINSQLAKLPEPFSLDLLLNNNILDRKLPC
jgi:hypothetical protein